MDKFSKPSGEQGLPAQNEQDTPDAGSSATGIFGRETIAPRTANDQDSLISLLRHSTAPSTGRDDDPGREAAIGPAPDILSRPVPVSPPAAPPAPPPSAPQAVGSGEVTRILQRVKPPGAKQDLAAVFKQVPIEKPPAPPPPRSEPPLASAPSRSASGSFTQAFREISKKSAGSALPPAALPSSPKPEAAGPGEFTKLFQSVQMEPEPAVRQPDPPHVSGALPIREAATDSLTQLFAKGVSELENRGEPWPQTPKADTPFSSDSLLRKEPLSAQGNFTQLYQALDQGPVAPAKPVEAALPPVSPATPAAPGGFTQLLESLSSKEAPPPIPSAPLPSPPSQPVAAAPASAEPGEYTRVISASALRENRARTAPPPTPPAAASPGVRPSIPMPPMGMPPMSAPQMPAAAAPHAMPAAVPMQAPAFSFPAMPMAAPTPPPAPQPSGLQKYVPLLLLVNIFVELAILLLVLIVLLRHP